MAPDWTEGNPDNDLDNEKPEIDPVSNYDDGACNGENDENNQITGVRRREEVMNDNEQINSNLSHFNPKWNRI